MDNTSQDSNDWCFSPCFTVVNQGWQLEQNTIELKYNKMPENCIRGVDIKITCPGFNNPVYKEIWEGFIISTYDSDLSPAAIEDSESVGLDATQYDVVELDPSLFAINPEN